MIKGIIFDLDGVLVHTDDYHYKAWKVVADRLGLEFDEQINNRLRGVSRMESFEIILEHNSRSMDENEKLQYTTEKNEVYKESLNEMSPESLDSGVLDTLNELRRRGIKTAIGSSSRNAKFILEKTGITELFDAVSDGTNIKNSKPDPEVFLKAAEFLGLEPAECLVVEDAYSGIDAAIAGGFRSAAIGDAVNYGKADFILSSVSDLLNNI